MCKRPAKPLKGAPASWRHDDRKGWKSALQYPFSTVDFKSRRSLYTGHHGAPPLGAMAHLRSSSPYRGFSSSPCWKREGFEALRFPEGGAGDLSAGGLLFEIVDRKKEKRRRRSPCGLFLRGRKPVLEGSKRNFGVLRFDSSSLIGFTGRESGTEIDVLGTRQTL